MTTVDDHDGDLEDYELPSPPLQEDVEAYAELSGRYQPEAGSLEPNVHVQDNDDTIIREYSFPIPCSRPGKHAMDELSRYSYKVGSDATRRVVVQKDDDTLTAEETRKHWRQVEQAMLDELITWAKLKCFSRKNRANARNIIDTRWVLKFKHKQETTDAENSGAAASHDHQSDSCPLDRSRIQRS